MPWAYAMTMEYQVLEDCAGTTVGAQISRKGEEVARNREVSASLSIFFG